ncbi:hypothetical protein PG984_007240 [Apiospora sp. TS-2023a]
MALRKVTSRNLVDGWADLSLYAGQSLENSVYGSTVRTEIPSTIAMTRNLVIGQADRRKFEAACSSGYEDTLEKPSGPRTWLERDKTGEGFLCQARNEGRAWKGDHRADFLAVERPSRGLDRLANFLNGTMVNWYHATLGGFSKSEVKAHDVVRAALAVGLFTMAILVRHYVQNMVHRTGLVIVFTTIFAVGLALLTGAKKAEVFAATAAFAAFAAVKVVYTGSVTSNESVCIYSPNDTSYG